MQHVFLSVFTVFAVFQQQPTAGSYHLTDLGPVKMPEFHRGLQLNQSGKVAAVRPHPFPTSSDGVPFRWSGGQVTFLPTVSGNAESMVVEEIMPSGTIFGNSNAGITLWSENQIIGMGWLGFITVLGRAALDSGWIAGEYSPDASSTNPRGFLFTGTTFFDIGTLGGTRTLVEAMNAGGAIVGYSTNALGRTHAYRWKAGLMKDLGALAGASGESFAYDVNDADLAVGFSLPISPSNKRHAVRFDASGPTDLGFVPGFDESIATAINNSGQIVGYSKLGTTPERATLWEGGQVFSLNSHFDTGGIYNLLGASDVNNLGQIVGYARVGTETRGVLLTPACLAQTLPYLQPAGVTVYGSGTHGCTPCVFLEAVSKSAIGNTQFGFRCLRAPAGALGLALLGDTPDLPGSNSLGIGALLHVNLAASLWIGAFDFPVDAFGIARLPLQVPNDPALVGAKFYGQGLFIESGACAPQPLGVVTSNGLEIVVSAP